MRANARTDIGLIRQANEDSYACVNPRLYIVADGMGGHVAGEIASNLVVETVKNFINHCEMKEEIDENILKEAISAANDTIFQKAQAHQEYSGMGTTISLVYFKENECLWAHVGDSRIYLHRNGCLSQLTNDHSLVWDLVSSGSITEDEAASHPQKNLLTRAVGVGTTVNIDTGMLTVSHGDRILLCSDGLTNMIGNEKIKEIIEKAPLDAAADSLVKSALAAGGIDNITAIVIER